MDFGDVVLEHRPVVICQCKYDLCAQCSVPKDEHFTKEEFGEESDINPHDFFQRSKVWGPRVIIDQITQRGKCLDCGREYITEVREVTFLDNKKELDKILEETNAPIN
jgi:hypothetical protein